MGKRISPKEPFKLEVKVRLPADIEGGWLERVYRVSGQHGVEGLAKDLLEEVVKYKELYNKMKKEKESK